MNNTNQTPNPNINRRIFFIIAGIILASAIIVYLSMTLAPESEMPDETIDSVSTSSTTLGDSKATIGQQNALTKAIAYIDTSDFSEEKLRKQLEFEGFTTEEIDYAMDIVPADYDLEASNRAYIYYTTQSLSKERIREQLQYEGYTEEQINYAINVLQD